MSDAAAPNENEPHEAAPDEGAPASPPPARRGRWRRPLAWTAAVVAVALIAAAGTAYGYYRSLRGDMVQHDLGSALPEMERPPKIGDDLNILFIGSDVRTGDNAEYGGKDFVGERSDSLMLAHISPDKGVTMVNFPRDSVVELPECTPYGKTEGTPGYYGMINAALFHGGPPCAVKAVESLTDIRVDHFVHLSFVGFRDMVDAVGGVRMCIPEPMKDERSHLDLDAGRQTLDGRESLAFVRARYEIGDGGDIGRIDRQQIFLSELATKATSSDVLTDPAKLTGLLEAVSKHTSTDDDLTLDTMLSLGSTLGDTDVKDITFYTVPWEQAPFDPNRVVWNEEKADRLFHAINNDRPLDDAQLQTGRPEPSASPSGKGGPSATPSYPAEPPERETGGKRGQADPDEIEGRDATSDACVNGLGEGTGDD
ncbi:LytR family transcriptional attenuator [Murinocardiopsis flavida]|uniref:LytR family transcriptional attenuator n=1 Tax=Murinocardiopsis flavida TaxID=645275 RepID=A0A2P8CPK1_9ACTN|nr:LCP family protein [Murinocardiopsis flavida]PSK86895.1 LytR family transcriptional attenuator [Murinocardiopsis flavida]